MRVIEYTRYGPPEVLGIREVSKPAPKDDEILIRVRATTVTSGDSRVRAFRVPFGFWLPARLALGITGPRKTVLGTEFAGDVEAVGKDVRSFREGDAVFAFPGASLGAYAEYVCVRADGPVAGKPPNLSYEEAAAVPFGAMTALYFLRDLGRIQRGHKVLVYGASGNVGTAAVQLARHFGAEVTGVCSTANLDLVRSLGADAVLDYTGQDFTTGGATYDLVLETVGKVPFSRCKRALKPGGRCLLVVAGVSDFFRMLWTRMSGGQRALAGVATEKREDLLFLRELVESGELRPVIDRSYRFDEIVEAHRYVDQGHKKGSVVVSVGGS